MTQMFYNCRNLNYLLICSFNVENVQYLNMMFGRCSNLLYLNLSSFKLNQQNVNGMLCECYFYTTFLYHISFKPKIEIMLRPDNERYYCPYWSGFIIDSF
jgi:surface protein